MLRYKALKDTTRPWTMYIIRWAAEVGPWGRFGIRRCDEYVSGRCACTQDLAVSLHRRRFTPCTPTSPASSRYVQTIGNLDCTIMEGYLFHSVLFRHKSLEHIRWAISKRITRRKVQTLNSSRTGIRTSTSAFLRCACDQNRFSCAPLRYLRDWKFLQCHPSRRTTCRSTIILSTKSAAPVTFWDAIRLLTTSENGNGYFCIIES